MPQIDWRFQIEWGAVFVNGQRSEIESLKAPLPCPCRLEFYEAKYDQKMAAEAFPKFSKDYVVFEDEDLLVVFKPHHLATMPPKERRSYTLKSYVEEYVNTTIHIPSRLDSAACGLVPISKTPRMHDKLNRVYQHRRVRKSYLLESSSSVTWDEVVVDKKIAKDTAHPILRKLSETEGVEAHTHFALVQNRTASALIRAHPTTGRTHQLRVHITAVAEPMIGDNFYGGREDAELHLMSEAISFQHPLTHKELRIEVPADLRPSWAKV
jgi:23S rRNA-/tRNA-specific pseudouridylate synthase